MPIIGHAPRSLFESELPVGLCDHFARDPVVLNMSITIGKALSLRRNLIGRHLDLARTFNQLLELLCHRVLSRFRSGRYLRTRLYSNKFLAGSLRMPVLGTKFIENQVVRA